MSQQKKKPEVSPTTFHKPQDRNHDAARGGRLRTLLSLIQDERRALDRLSQTQSDLRATMKHVPKDSTLANPKSEQLRTRQDEI
eukprot:2497680-Rhodomonas_salina.1